MNYTSSKLGFVFFCFGVGFGGVIKKKKNNSYSSSIKSGLSLKGILMRKSHVENKLRPCASEELALNLPSLGLTFPIWREESRVGSSRGEGIREAGP